MVSERNGDYSASKFALTAFTDTLRMEPLTKNPKIQLTNFYPYYINTGLFKGFKPLLGYLIPTLTQEYVTNYMYKAIMAHK